MIKKVKYVALDGKEFEQDYQCEQYEETLEMVPPRMANWNDIDTEDYDEAVYVELRTDAEVMWFLHRIQHDEMLDSEWIDDTLEDYHWCVSNDLKKSYYGFWYYDENYNRYRQIEPGMVEFIRNGK